MDGAKNMKTELMTILVTLVLVSTTPLAAADEHWDEDREFTYAGTTRQDHNLNEVCADATGGECPIVIPSGIAQISCDHTGGMFFTGIQGIGGGKFCGVRMGTTITVTLHDELLELPSATVTCPYASEVIYPPPGSPWPPLIGVTWHKDLGEAVPSLTIDVPTDCMNTEQENGLTEIHFFFNLGTATTGTATLEYE